MKLASAAFLLFAPGIASGEKIGSVPRASSLARHGLRRLEDRSKADGPKKASTRAHDLLRHRRLPKQDVTCSVETLDFDGQYLPGALCVTKKNQHFCIAHNGEELIPLRIATDYRRGMNKMKSVDVVISDMEACEDFAAFADSGCLNPENPEAWDPFVCAAMQPIETCVWTVVNDADAIPEADGSSPTKNFSSYNPPSVSKNGLVVFRARSTGNDGQNEESGKPKTGIFVRNPTITIPVQPIMDIQVKAARGGTVPQPNNLDTDFIEFPSIPRIAIGNSNLAFRGNHAPVLRYSIEVEGEEEPVETRVGNTGLYSSFGGDVFTAVGKLGSVPLENVEGFDFSKFKVPVVLDPTSFDVFPGAPAIDEQGRTAFKGNYAKDGIPQTGVFFRQLTPGLEGGSEPIYHIASSSETWIPASDCNDEEDLKLGSAAAPSIAKGMILFRGVDNEDAPTCGGIYGAALVPDPSLTALVTVATPVPGDEGFTFGLFGEALSFDGSAFSFWGAWDLADDSVEIKLCCPTHGQADLKAYCSHTGIYDDECTGDECQEGDPNTIFDEYGPDGCDVDVGYQVKYVPNKQGIFVVKDGSITTVAKTYNIDEANFLFWKYSGKPPSVGFGRPDSTTAPAAEAAVEVESTTTDDESDAAEPPRWRSATSAALDSHDTVSENPRVAFKMKQTIDSADVVGIYLGDGSSDSFKKIVETGDLCTNLDPMGVLDDGTSLDIDSLALDRDGFRGGRLALAAECAEVPSGARMLAEEEEEEADWGGIYLIDVDEWLACYPEE